MEYLNQLLFCVIVTSYHLAVMCYSALILVSMEAYRNYFRATYNLTLCKTLGIYFNQLVEQLYR